MATIHGFALGTQRPGTGGMGEVFVAKRLQGLPGFPAGGSVVIKMTPVGREDWVAALRREADILAQLEHIEPQLSVLQGVGIARIQPADVGADGRYAYYAEDTADGWHEANGPAARAFIVLDDVRGISLGRYVAARPGKRMTPYEACLVALRLARLLEILHKEGKVLHNDVKPDNVVVGPGGAPFKLALVDFGISLRLDERLQVYPGQHAMAYWGGHDYVAPEKVLGQNKTPGAPLDWRSDLWSLSALIVFMVGQSQLLKREFGGKIELPPSIPEPLLSFLRRALNPSPTDRHASWAEVKEDLQKCMRTLRETFPRSPSVRWRSARAVAVGAIVLGTAAAGIAIAAQDGLFGAFGFSQTSATSTPPSRAPSSTPPGGGAAPTTGGPGAGLIQLPTENGSTSSGSSGCRIDRVTYQYVTEPGDTIKGLAEACGVAPQVLANINHIPEIERPIPVGLTIQFPLPTATPLPTPPPTVRLPTPRPTVLRLDPTAGGSVP